MTGIPCPNCGCRDWRTGSAVPPDAIPSGAWDVTKTEQRRGYIRRRRVCRHCRHVVYTREQVE